MDPAKFNALVDAHKRGLPQRCGMTNLVARLFLEKCHGWYVIGSSVGSRHTGEISGVPIKYRLIKAIPIGAHGIMRIDESDSTLDIQGGPRVDLCSPELVRNDTPLIRIIRDHITQQSRKP